MLRSNRKPSTLLVLGLVAFAIMNLATRARAFAAHERVLANLGTGSNALKPISAPIMDAAGNLYGTAGGGAYGGGTIYKLTPDGTETVLRSFGNGTDGTSPYPGASLVIDASGNLYGTTQQGGTYNEGTVFKLAPDGTETVLWSFGSGTDGSYPEGGLVIDASGNLYGTTADGGAYGAGTVFKVTPDGTETVIWSFGNGSDGANPEAGLTMDASGNLYGTTFNGPNGGTIFKLTPAGTESILWSGMALQTPVIIDASGNLYGTTTFGGGAYGAGTVFKVTPDGTETVLWSFGNGTDGSYPAGSLILDASGNLYGVTGGGGTKGAGTVFKLTPDGTETVLWSFGNGTDGSGPTGLIMNSSGNLVGTTEGGGAYGDGTLFELTPQGTETVLWNFGSPPVGATPEAGLLRDTHGNLYGTTYYGGSGTYGGGYGAGTVFKIAPDGTQTILWNFGTNGTDGQHPHSNLIMDRNGNLYGTTEAGGAYGVPSSAPSNGGNDSLYGGGIVFELTPPSSKGGSWTESVLWNFAAATSGPVASNPNPHDGIAPEAGLIMDKNGNLYGTTQYGGTYGAFAIYEHDNLFPGPISGGTIFELSPPAAAGGSWSESILWNFGSGTDGNGPVASLIVDRNGNLYGTTANGGTYGVPSEFGPQGGGTVFKLSPPASSSISWAESILWNFGNGADGQLPQAGLVMDRQGNLYGTTSAGGTYSLGTVFKLTSSGDESVLWSFGNDSDGADPLSSLVMDLRGNLYGTTVNGGAYTGTTTLYGTTTTSSLGTVFKLSPSSRSSTGNWNESIVWSFGNGTDGTHPEAGLITDERGDLYGTTSAGGTNRGTNPNGGGTVFKIDQSYRRGRAH